MEMPEFEGNNYEFEEGWVLNCSRSGTSRRFHWTLNLVFRALQSKPLRYKKDPFEKVFLENYLDTSNLYPLKSLSTVQETDLYNKWLLLIQLCSHAETQAKCEEAATHSAVSKQKSSASFSLSPSVTFKKPRILRNALFVKIQIIII